MYSNKKEVKVSSYVLNAMLVTVSAFVFFIMLIASLDYSLKVKVCKQTIAELEEELEDTVNNKPTDRVVPGKAKFDNPVAFNSFNTSGWYTELGKKECSLSFYNITGIQLYFMDYVYGDTKFETEDDLNKDVKSKLESLPNIDNSMVVYRYSTSYDYPSPYSYYSRDLTYYGKNVSSYLTADDLTIINYYFNNASNLWDYEDRDIKMWSTIGDKIINGYTVGETESSNMEDTIQGYIDALNVMRSITIVCAIFAIIFGALLVLGVVNIYKNVKLSHKQIEAEIGLQEARAVKEILEADIESFVDSNEELVRKYTDMEVEI